MGGASAKGGIAGRNQGPRGQEVVDQPGPAERDARLGEHSLDHERVGVEAERGCGGAVGDSGLGEPALPGEPALAAIAFEMNQRPPTQILDAPEGAKARPEPRGASGGGAPGDQGTQVPRAMAGELAPRPHNTPASE